MSAPDDLGGLNSEQWRDLCDCASKLEKTLEAGATQVDLRRFLPPPEAPHRQAVLVELIKTELEARYRDSRGVPLEAFLTRYPELGGRDSVPAGLIYEEYRVRRLHGDRPDLAIYRERFPSQFAKVEELLRVNPVPERPVHEHPTQRGNAASAPLPRATQAADLVLSGGQGYQKLEPLGRGEFGEVWRARAPGGVEVALKIITRTVDHEASQRELKALEKIRELRHPFLLQTHQYQAEKDHLIIVMELADGSLSDRYKECKAKELPGVPVDELVTYFTQAAEALDYLHSQHVSHRDIKPQNLLSLRGYAKVADFGLARWQEQTVDNASVVCGTPHYMAPEIWKLQISTHSDQYSLAATYFEMRLGRRVFPGKTPFEVAEHHLRSAPQLDPLPAAEQAVLRRALAKEPDQRFPSCVAFAQALREAVTPKKVEPPPPRSSWPVKALIASPALALIVLLIVLYFLWPSHPAEPKLWRPEGWEPENAADVIKDPKSQRDYYRRLVRKVDGQTVVMIAIPQNSPTDPPLFYMMENKVWNDLYAAFMADRKSKEYFERYRLRPGGEQWFRGEWEKGAHAPGAKPPRLALGVGDGRGDIPVFRVTVTEAHCFAEWLGGRLPRRDQWLKAAGVGEDPRPGPFGDPASVAVKLGEEGPWPVSRGNEDVSKYGCRQMAGNGKEWTRTLHDSDQEEIPLQQMNGARPVLVCGQSYAALLPLAFKQMAELDDKSCTENHPEIGFRMVLEP